MELVDVSDGAVVLQRGWTGSQGLLIGLSPLILDGFFFDFKAYDEINQLVPDLSIFQTLLELQDPKVGKIIRMQQLESVSVRVDLASIESLVLARAFFIFSSKCLLHQFELILCESDLLELYQTFLALHFILQLMQTERDRFPFWHCSTPGELTISKTFGHHLIHRNIAAWLEFRLGYVTGFDALASWTLLVAMGLLDHCKATCGDGHDPWLLL